MRSMGQEDGFWKVVTRRVIHEEAEGAPLRCVLGVAEDPLSEGQVLFALFDASQSYCTSKAHD